MDKRYDAIILAVAHKEFLDIDFSLIKNEKSIVYDVKGVLDKGVYNKRLQCIHLNITT